VSEHKDEQNRDDLGFLDGMVEAVRADAPEEAQWQAARRNLMGRLEAPQKENVMTRVFGRSRSRRIGWAVAAGIVAIAVAVLVALNPWGRGPGQAFAAVVEQFRNARTMTFTVTVEVEGRVMQLECAFKEPGYFRQTMANGDVSIADMTQKKAIALMPRTKEFIEIDFSNAPENQFAAEFFGNLRTLPDKADELIEEREMDGHLVQGFRVTLEEEGCKIIVWVDAETREPVRVELVGLNAPDLDAPDLNTPGPRVVMSNFQFDVDLDDSLFSLTPPQGYTGFGVDIDLSEANEQDLIAFLRFWVTHSKEGLFPPTLDPVGLASAGMEEEIQPGQQALRGLMFLKQMKPGNDWHYAGEGVQLGAAATPICWWKPDGSETYRVIYGDLSVEDMAPEDVPSAHEKQETE